MADLLCQNCKKTMSANKIFECPKCGKFLCESCKGYGSHCKDSKNGTAGCDGYWKRRS
jgi:hypothetical protein